MCSRAQTRIGLSRRAVLPTYRDLAQQSADRNGNLAGRDGVPRRTYRRSTQFSEAMCRNSDSVLV